MAGRMEKRAVELTDFTDISSILRAGVYALCKRGVVIYVGKSKSLYARIYTHRHFANRGAKGLRVPDWLPVKGIQFDQVFIRPCHLDDLDRLEAEMVNRYKPRYNQSLKNNLKVGPISVTIGGVLIQTNDPPRPQIERRA
jgi:excinuclease UvrABC nuclease subunit